MKVVLLKDVQGLGKRGEVKDVRAGYARNFLFRERCALPGNEGNLKVAEHIARGIRRKEEKRQKQLAEAMKGLEQVALVLRAKASKEGKLFGSITAAMILEELAKTGHAGIPESWLVMSEPLKTTGEHVLSLAPSSDVTIPIRVTISEEK